MSLPSDAHQAKSNTRLRSEKVFRKDSWTWVRLPPSPPLGMLAVFCTYGLGLIPQAVQRKAMVMSIWM